MEKKFLELDSLYNLKKKDIKRACNVLTQAFFKDPLFMFLFPDTKKRKKIYYMFYVSLNYVNNYGFILATSEKMEGLMALIPPKTKKKNICALLKSKGYIIPFIMNWRKTMEIQKYIDEIHKKAIDVPHWYLTSIAVDPKHKNKGFASKLLRPILEFLDSKEEICYLETENERNISFYEHFGFEIVISEKIPNSNVSVWGMIRKPKKFD